MKRTLLLLSFLFSAFPALCQCAGTGFVVFSFDGASYDYYNCNIQRDTADTVNPWQIGTPIKSIFSSAHSLQKVIATDTSHSYRPNDTSTFLIKRVVDGGTAPYCYITAISGYYFVDSDPITDRGSIEFSPDNGSTWIDLLYDTMGIVEWPSTTGPKPTLSGYSFEWKYFSCFLHFVGTPQSPYTGDTVQYRFSFISDTIDTHREGLMFDDISVDEIACEGISTKSKRTEHIHIFPDPANDRLFFNGGGNTTHQAISITNYLGQTVATYPDPPSNELDIHDLPPGMYLLHYTDAETNEVHKFSIQR